MTLKTLEEDYDWVLEDSPPLLTIEDPSKC